MTERACLALMCKDEAACIVRTLESVKPMIDRWVVLDTGSTDGTQDLVRQALKDIPGELHQHPFVNFAYNRTLLLRLVRESGAPWALVCDADWSMKGSFHAPRADCGMVPVMVLGYGSMLLRHGLVLRASKPWRYIGPVHEMLTCDEPFTEQNISGLRVVAGAFTPATAQALERKQKRLHWDRRVLIEAYELNGQRDARSAFLLGQTCRDLGDNRSAIDWFDRAAELLAGMPGNDEMRWYSMYMAGALMIGPEHIENSIYRLLRAWRERPSRAEPLWELSALFNKLGDVKLAGYFEAERGKLPPPVSDRMVHLAAYGPRPKVAANGEASESGNHSPASSLAS